ncbi:hypothetical protein [Tenacibaculum sp. nBUS_03]|uniref:hypothetical protein n=1 Tax=Tenacibaculum sp. nBUS_03 TaxID=3395320 RepID=UPI003EBE8AD4
MEYPIITKKTKSFFPNDEICPICKTNRITLNSEFYVLNGGALEKINNDTSIPSDIMEGFLSVQYHSGENSENYGFNIDIVDESKGGQFDIYFCSTNCMKEFFNQLIDTIEKKTTANKV